MEERDKADATLVEYLRNMSLLTGTSDISAQGPIGT